MASLGHVAMGMLAGRLFVGESSRNAVLPMVAFSALALLPDLDYVGVMLGVANAGPCGHRGASHSIAAPLLVMLVAAAAAPLMGLPRWRTALLSAAAVATHAVLDALTASGRGLPIFWPLNFHRVELPWRPIPDAPCGLGFVSMAGLRTACIEMMLFSPVLVGALVPGALRHTLARTVRRTLRRTLRRIGSPLFRPIEANLTNLRPRP